MAFTIISPPNSTKEISLSYYIHSLSKSGSPLTELSESINSYALILDLYSKPDAHDVNLLLLELPGRLLREMDL